MRAREPDAEGYVDRGGGMLHHEVFGGFEEPSTSTEGWARYNRHYWLDHYQDFLEFFFSQCFIEPHSTKPIQDRPGAGRGHRRRPGRPGGRRPHPDGPPPGQDQPAHP